MGNACGPGGALGGGGTVTGSGISIAEMSGRSGGSGGASRGSGILPVEIVVVTVVGTGETAFSFSSTFFCGGGDTGCHSSPFLCCWPLLTGNCILNSLVRSMVDFIGSGTEFCRQKY